MFEINRNPFIRIDLKPGVYVFRNASGSGKTWLYNLFYTYEGFGDPVACYTYRDYKMNRDPAIEFAKAKVIMIDRYDLYKSHLDKLIASLADKIILIDYKTCYAAREKDNLCQIHLYSNGIEVTS